MGARPPPAAPRNAGILPASESGCYTLPQFPFLA
jgi:hypothetical protein